MHTNRALLGPSIAKILNTDCELNVLFAGAGSGHAEPYWDFVDQNIVKTFLVDPLSKLGFSQTSKVIPCALSDHDARCDLYVAQAASASSLKPLNQASVQDATLYGDELLSDLMKNVEKVAVETRTVDGLQAEEILPALHFIKLNIEGSELDALRGARQALTSCFGVQIEVSFKSMWENSPFFSDVDSFLRSSGFEFHQMLAPIHHGKKNKYIKIKSDQSMNVFPFPSNQIFQAHVLYLRPDSFVCEGGQMRCSLEAAVKLIIISEIYGLLEKAFYIADALEPFVSLDRKVAYCEHLRASAQSYKSIYVDRGCLSSANGLRPLVLRLLPGIGIWSGILRIYRGLSKNLRGFRSA